MTEYSFAPDDQPIEFPVEDFIDLHTFLPKEVPSLLKEYLIECAKADILEVRIIHGKGKGILREKVHAFLRKSPLVESYQLAEQDRGSWGATIVRLRRL